LASNDPPNFFVQANSIVGEQASVEELKISREKKRKRPHDPAARDPAASPHGSAASREAAFYLGF
jgi:hypothetical protein